MGRNTKSKVLEALHKQRKILQRFLLKGLFWYHGLKLQVGADSLQK